jgi:UDP-N-acetylglucosamine/UDP-N-acetylgalactosamine diphosphorylase
MIGAVQKAIGKLAVDSPSSSEPQANDVQSLREKFEAVDQGHLFNFWDQLSAEEKSVFYEQLAKFEPERVAVCSPECTTEKSLLN